MIDTRAVGKELQEQLAGAARRGQEQAKRAQEQVRKGQEVVTEVVKTLTVTAESFRPQLPTIKLPSLPRPSLPLPPLNKLPGASTVMTSAQEIADQLVATQRRLTDQVTETAGPWFAQGAARFNQAAQSILPTGTFGPASQTTNDAKTSGATERAGTAGPAGTSETTTTAGGRKGTEPRKTVPRRSSVSTARKPSTAAAKADAAKTGAAKASAAKTGTAKAGSAKSGQEKATTRKNGAGRTKPDSAKD
jgi:hypothetical protein